MDVSGADSTQAPEWRSRADASLDACGLRCPEPLMLVRRRIRALASGEQLYVVATDPSTTRDITQYCRFIGHELVASAERDGYYHYLIRKGER